MNLAPISQTASRAAFRAGRILTERFGKITKVTHKGAIDLVTEADIESEKMIVSTIREAFPDHSILAEESGLYRQNDDYRWIIDPLDGTTNFSHGLPIYSISIAFSQLNEILMGLVFAPSTGDYFYAQKGHGAYLNNQSIRVSSTSKIKECLLITGFAYDSISYMDTLIARFRRCLAASQGVRRLGSAALDLCFVASGRFDGFWEEGLKPWDTAAGVLIASEAGGCITTFSSKPFFLESKELLATNGHIHREMTELLLIQEER